MAETTEKLGLTKPAGNEYAEIDTLNTNMDIIDAAVGELMEGGGTEEIKDAIGESDSTDTNTLMGKVNKTLEKLSEMEMRGSVKSVQRGVATGTSVTIAEVDPAKCIVILNNQYIGNNTVATYGGAGGVTKEVSKIPEGAIVASVTETELTLTNNIVYKASENKVSGFDFADYEGSVSWQVIEFY